VNNSETAKLRRGVLIFPWDGELPLRPAAFNWRQAARARQISEGVTSRAMKARLLEDATQYDELAAEADSIGEDATDSRRDMVWQKRIRLPEAL